jgi:PAS domain S-box-containing protein
MGYKNLNFLTILKPFVSSFKQLSQQGSSANDSTLMIWRKRIFNAIFLCATLTSTFAYIPNVKHSIKIGQWPTATIYTIAFLTPLCIVVIQAIPFKVRAWTGLIMFFGVGLTSLLALGPVGSGRMFLFAFALMASLLLGLRAGALALILNMATILSITWALSRGHLQWPHLTDYSIEKWETAGYTFFFFNAVVTVSIGVLVNALEKNLQKEQTLSKQLKLSNENLERENTERRQSEKALKISQEKYKTLTNNLHVGIYRNTVGNEGKFLEANPAILQMFGYKTKKEFLNISVADLYQNSNARKKLNLKMLQNGFVRNEELQLKKKDGTPIVCSVSAVAVRDEHGEVKYYDGFIEDITERKQLESQLQQAQKMEAIGTLAGGVAHDLNNILSGMVSYPELLLMDLPHGSPLKQPLLTIQQSGQKAAAIVQDLLTLARRGVSVRENIDLNQLIEQYLNSPEHQKIMEYHPGIEVASDLEPGQLNIVGSPVHLSKTVMNLVSNAAEAMPEGGRILIATDTCYIDKSLKGYDTVKEGDYARLKVSDTGVGISSEDLDRIFEPFFTKKTMGRSGTGLGMAVVWGTVKDHSGYIDVQSNLGEGTEFTLNFPIARTEVDKDKPKISIDKYKGRGESILVVDDVKEQRKIASQILEKLGYNVKSVPSGEEALRYLKENAADLLVLDMIMNPGIDGLETYKKILEFHPDQKAVIASGYSESDRVKEAQNMGAGAYIKKPYSFEKIGMAVKNELLKKQEVSGVNSTS